MSLTENKAERAGMILKFLKKVYPDAKCHLNFDTPLELLIGSILSAQCTDERVNSVTPGLFRKYKDASGFSKADINELEHEIHSTGFFRNKAKSIRACCQKIINEHGGKVPDTMCELVKLPGVGRKTANVILGNYFKKPGIIVDTHIKRLSNRLGLTESSDPVKIEFELRELIPQDEWTFFSNALGDHGRNVCKSRKPLCPECGISSICPYYHSLSKL